MINKEKLKEFDKLHQQLEFVEACGFNTRQGGYAKRIEYYDDIKKYVYLAIDLIKSAEFKKVKCNFNILYTKHYIIDEQTTQYLFRICHYHKHYYLGDNIRFWKLPKYYKKKHFNDFDDLHKFISFKTKIYFDKEGKLIKI